MSTLCDSPKDKFDTYLLCVCIRVLSTFGVNNQAATRTLSDLLKSIRIGYCSPSRLRFISDAIKLKAQSSRILQRVYSVH